MKIVAYILNNPDLTCFNNNFLHVHVQIIAGGISKRTTGFVTSEDKKLGNFDDSFFYL